MKLAGLKNWVFFAGFSLGVLVAATASVTASRHQDQALDDAALLYTILKQIQSYYVDEVSYDRLVDDAIEAITANLDPHSVYLDPSSFEHLNAVTTGSYAGIGVEVELTSEGVTVIAPFQGSPAERAGLKSGDVLLAIDETPLTRDNQQQVLDLINGPVGGKVALTIARLAEPDPLVLIVERAIINIDSVHSSRMDDIGYIRISAFQEDTADEVVSAMREFNRESPVRGLVLDLRDNPGGILDGALDVADIFLNEGVIVTTRGRYHEANVVFFASEGDLLGGKQMVILINGSSASAAEIVAGALQSNRRAVVLGEQSFGKGSIQSLFPLPAGRGVMKLTTAHYFTPNGRSIDGEGIVPDRVVLPEVLDLAGQYGPIIDPLALEGASASLLTRQDFQLTEALKLLTTSRR